MAATLDELEAGAAAGRISRDDGGLVTVDVLGRYRHDRQLLPGGRWPHLRTAFRTVHCRQGPRGRLRHRPEPDRGAVRVPQPDRRRPGARPGHARRRRLPARRGTAPAVRRHDPRPPRPRSSSPRPPTLHPSSPNSSDRGSCAPWALEPRCRARARRAGVECSPSATAPTGRSSDAAPFPGAGTPAKRRSRNTLLWAGSRGTAVAHVTGEPLTIAPRPYFFRR